MQYMFHSIVHILLKQRNKVIAKDGQTISITIILLNNNISAAGICNCHWDKRKYSYA